MFDVNAGRSEGSDGVDQLFLQVVIGVEWREKKESEFLRWLGVQQDFFVNCNERKIASYKSRWMDDQQQLVGNGI